MALQSFGMSGYGKQMDQPFDQSNSGSTVQRTTQSTAADTMASMLIGDYQRLRIDERQQWMDKVAHCEKKIKNLKTEVQDLKDNLEDFAALKAQNGELRGKLEDAEEAANNYKVMYDSAMHKLEELADTSTATLASASVEIERLQTELAHRTNPRTEKKERKPRGDKLCKFGDDCHRSYCGFIHPSQQQPRQPPPAPSPSRPVDELLASKLSESLRPPVNPADAPPHLAQHHHVVAAIRQPEPKQLETSVRTISTAAESTRRRYQPAAGSFSLGQQLTASAQPFAPTQLLTPEQKQSSTTLTAPQLRTTGDSTTLAYANDSDYEDATTVLTRTTIQ